MEMFDKLQFVAGFHYSSTAESHDKLKFVEHFWIRQRYREVAQSVHSFSAAQPGISHFAML